MQRIPLIFATDGIFPTAVGGMQRHSRLLIEALAQTGEVDILVVHPHHDDPQFPGLMNVSELGIRAFPGAKHYYFELGNYSNRVREIAEKYPEHLIYNQGLSIWKGIERVGHRTITNPHGLEPYQATGFVNRIKTWPYRMAFNHVFRQSRKVVSLGGRLTDIIQPRLKDPNQLVVLPNATNPLPEQDQLLYKRKADVLTFMFVGRFSSNKGIGDLLEAVRILNERGLTERFRLDLSGKGPLFEEMRERYAFPNVKFRGFVSDEDLMQAYRDNHVFVLPTLYEGMPTVILEAMARAMPILVTDVGATLELVGPENGTIIPRENPAALAEAMLNMITLEEETYAAMSRASLQKFKALFTWEAVAKAHLDLFRTVYRELKND